MNRFLTISAATVFTLLMASVQAPKAEAGECLKEVACKIACCPKCSHSCETCKLDAEMVDVEKSCFEVECKKICIPCVVFPWQKKKCHSCNSCDGSGCSSCINNGAKVRTVKVLKKKKYTCPECEYSWTPEEGSACCSSPCGGCGCGEANCDGGCCDAGCDSGITYGMPQPAGSYQPTYQAAGSQHELPPAAQYGEPSLTPVQVRSAY